MPDYNVSTYTQTPPGGEHLFGWTDETTLTDSLSTLFTPIRTPAFGMYLYNNEGNDIDKDNMIDIIRNGIKNKSLDLSLLFSKLISFKLFFISSLENILILLVGAKALNKLV